MFSPPLNRWHQHFNGLGDKPVKCLGGKGYELMWPEKGGIMAEGVERMKFYWEKGTNFSPPDRVFHQHFCIGKEPARLFAFHNERSTKFKGIKAKKFGAIVSIKLGGNQINYEDKDPYIRALFKKELAKTRYRF